MRTTIDPIAVEEFLALGRIAVVGASDRKENFGRTVYTELKAHDHEVVAVHPTATTVDGDPAYPDLAAVPGQVDGVVVMVPAVESSEVVRACVDRGVRHVWLFRGAGTGAVSEEALGVCREHDIAVVAGACPLMFLEPVGLVHRIHRNFRHLNGSLARTPA